MSYYQPPVPGYQPYNQYQPPPPNQFNPPPPQQQQQQYGYYPPGVPQPPQGPPGYGYQPPPPAYQQGPPNGYRPGPPGPHGHPPHGPPGPHGHPPHGPHGHPPQQPIPTLSHLPQMTTQWVQDATSFKQVLDGVASVAATNKLGYFDAPRAYNDIAIVLWDTKRYALASGEYFTNEGELMNVLNIKGLLPIVFRGSTYKTPIVVHIPNSYPSKAPIIYVTPTQDLRISPKCPHVQGDGMVVHPIINNWDRTSTITQVLEQIGLAFGQVPPLYAAPANSQPPTPAHGANNSHQSQFKPPTPSEPTPQQLEQRRRQELEQMVEVKLVSAQQGQYDTLKKQLEELNQKKMILHRSHHKNEFALESINDQLAQYNKLCNALDEDIKMLKELIETANNSQSSNNSNNNDSNDNNNKAQEILNDSKLSFDKYDRQLILEDATDSAIDDLLQQLAQLLDENKITMDAYLKEVRTLSRKQFMARTLARKIMNQM